jgi:lipopolysaccharide export system permease protein
MRRLIRPLDRYVMVEFLRIFIITALGFPLLVMVLDLTENIDKYLDRGIPGKDIALSYLYWLPDSTFMILPAATLFATVFTVGAMTRYSEITAAKASGISFHRMVAPIFIGAIFSVFLGLFLGEAAPRGNERRAELLREVDFQRGTHRFGFTYAAEHGRVYKINTLRADSGIVAGVEIERRGRDADYPTYFLMADNGSWNESAGNWTLYKGVYHLLTDSATSLAMTFDSAVDMRLTERPLELTARDKAPQDMGYQALGRFIEAMERSGAEHVNLLRVERMLKITIPVTSLIIVLFGAPLATSTQRGGAAYGVGISLATTIVFLVMIQLTKAMGKGGLMNPELAAWLPSIAFGVVGMVMLGRTRT